MNEFYASRCSPTKQRSHAIVFNSVGELLEDFIFSRCRFQQLKEEPLAGGSWGAQDAAHGASDNELVIRRGLKHREPPRTPLDRSCLLPPARPTLFTLRIHLSPPPLCPYDLHGAPRRKNYRKYPHPRQRNQKPRNSPGLSKALSVVSAPPLTSFPCPEEK